MADPHSPIPSEAVWSALGALGGLASYLNGFLAGEPFVIARSIATVVIAAIMGLLAGYAASTWDLPPYAVNCISGVCGGLGWRSMDVLLNMAKRWGVTAPATAPDQQGRG